jgi:hypothetical protein
VSLLKKRNLNAHTRGVEKEGERQRERDREREKEREKERLNLGQ